MKSFTTNVGGVARGPHLLLEHKGSRGVASGGEPKSKIKKKDRHGGQSLLIGQSLSLQVEDAIRALRNNETKITCEEKGLNGKMVSETKITYPAELVAALRGTFGAGRTYEFQLHQVGTNASSSGGATLNFQAISPTVASYGEWTALQALFDEGKAVSSRIDYCTLSPGPSATNPNTDIVISFDEQNLNTVPSSYLAVYRLAGSYTFVNQLGDRGSGKVSRSVKFQSRGWCDTATSSPPYSVSPMGGFIGCWVWANSGLFASSIAVATISSITVGKFRCRA